MRLAGIFILISASLTGLPLAALAQQEPPVPMPRPAFLDSRGETAAPVGDEQTMDVIEEGAPDADAADAARNAAASAAEALALPPQSVTISAWITEGGPQIPDGMVWRVFGTQADANGELPMVARSEDSVASLSLQPGEYLVHAAYGRSQVSDSLIVEGTATSKTVILDAGALRLKTAISGDINMPPSQVKFDIYTAGIEDDRVPIALNTPPEELIYLNAGVYNVVSRWGNINATVRADLRVEPGQVTEATLFHKAAQITWKLVSSEGGEAIADVEWSIRDADNNEVFADFGAFPTAVLAEGDYSVIATLGENVYNREFQVQPSGPREVEVLTAVY